MTGLHYPDNLYADHEERKARRSQQPTGAYRSQPEMPESERKLRTALSYVAHARDLITEALKLVEQERMPAEPERVPKWSPEWAAQVKRAGANLGCGGMQPPNCDGLSARDVRAHPMNAETLRAEDEFDRDDKASGV